MQRGLEKGAQRILSYILGQQHSAMVRRQGQSRHAGDTTYSPRLVSPFLSRLRQSSFSHRAKRVRFKQREHRSPQLPQHFALSTGHVRKLRQRGS